MHATLQSNWKHFKKFYFNPWHEETEVWDPCEQRQTGYIFNREKAAQTQREECAHRQGATENILPLSYSITADYFLYPPLNY